MADFDEIVDLSFGEEQQAQLSICFIKLLSSASLTVVNNLLAKAIDPLEGELISLDAQIDLLEAERNSFFDKTNDFLAGNIDALQSLQNAGIGNPFEAGTIDIPCLGTIPNLLDIVLNIPNFNLDLDAVAKAVRAAATIIVLSAAKNRILAVVARLTRDQRNINKALADRANGTAPEPTIDYTREDVKEALDGIAELDPDTSREIEDYKQFVETQIVEPFFAGQAAQDARRAQLRLQVDPKDEKLFDLVFGPPISTDGKFILSKDGLYYDSINGGIPDVAVQEALASNWKLEYDPNKGGKGIVVTKDINEFSNTVFSDNYTETNDVVEYLYDNDKIVQSFIGDKEKQISDVSANVTDLLDQGYDASSALVLNYRQNANAIAATYDKKIKKRKKQLQLAGLFGGYTLTDTSFPLGQGYIINRGEVIDAEGVPVGWTILTDNTATFSNGAEAKLYDILEYVPVNDFSFLRGSGLVPNLDYQTDNLVHAADVEGIIKPLPPKIITSLEGGTVYVDQFSVVDEPGTEFVKSSDSNASSTTASIKNLDDTVITDGLVACLNFLKADVEDASSTSYKLDNRSTSYSFLDAKLVAASATDIFPSGVSIAKLGGTLVKASDLYSPEPWYDALTNGGYARLKNNVTDGELDPRTQAIDNLTYNPDGFTVDFFTYVPNVLSDMTTSHRYRLFMGCENTGAGRAKDSDAPITACPNKFDGNGNVTTERDFSKVHGLIFGYRDKSDDDTLQLCVLPTVSQNKEDGTFGDSVALAEIPSNPYDPKSSHTELGFIIGMDATTSKGKTIGDVSSGFHHIALSVDYKKDKITAYINGEQLATSAVSTCFKLNPGQPLNVPSPASVDSERYSRSMGVNNNLRNTESLHEGAYEAPAFSLLTPWVIGGGFTDIVPRSRKMESDAGFNTTPLGFLGSNTNDTYYTTTVDGTTGGFQGQHSPGLGGSQYSGVNRVIPRSGLDGFIGNFKLYSRPLTTTEITQNYEAHQSFFENIQV